MVKYRTDNTRFLRSRGTTVSLFTPHIHTVALFIIVPELPTALRRLTSSFNRSGYLLALEYFLHLPDTRVTLGYSVRQRRRTLECGIIGTNYPDMDMISFGPNIRGAHSPDERVQISSVQKYWGYFIDVLQAIPSNN